MVAITYVCVNPRKLFQTVLCFSRSKIPEIFEYENVRDVIDTEVERQSSDLRQIIDRLYDAKRHLEDYLDESRYLLTSSEDADFRRKQKSLVDAIDAASRAIADSSVARCASRPGKRHRMRLPPPMQRRHHHRFERVTTSLVDGSLSQLHAQIDWLSVHAIVAAEDATADGGVDGASESVRRTPSLRRRRDGLRHGQRSDVIARRPSTKSGRQSSTDGPLSGVERSLLLTLTCVLRSVEALVDIAREEIETSLNMPPHELAQVDDEIETFDDPNESPWLLDGPECLWLVFNVSRIL